MRGRMWFVGLLVCGLLVGCSSSVGAGVSSSVDGLELPWVEDHRVVEAGGRSVVFTEDGGRLVIVPAPRRVGDDDVLVWDLEARESTWLRGHESALSDVTVGGDGLLASTAREELKIWDLSTGRRIHDIPYGPIVKEVVFSPDGSLLAVGKSFEEGEDSVSLWDVDSGELVRTLDGVRSVVDLVFTFDGSKVIAASNDGTVRISDVATGEQLSVLQQDKDESSAFLSLSPDGEMLATSGLYDEVWLWDLATEQVVKKYPIVRVEGKPRNILSIEFSPDGEMLLVTGVPEAVLFEVETGEVIQQFPASSEQGSTDGVFSPDGELIAIGDEVADVVIYRRNPK